MAGLVGAGRSEIAQALFGVDSSPSGTISVNGQNLPRGNVKEAIASGVCLAPEDRKASGLILEMTIRENMTFAIMPWLATARTSLLIQMCLCVWLCEQQRAWLPEQNPKTSRKTEVRKTLVFTIQNNSEAAEQREPWKRCFRQREPWDLVRVGDIARRVLCV